MSGALSSPGFDPAIALQAGRGVAPPNPLQTIGQFAQIQNQINQNTAFPGQMELQQQRIAGGKADLLQTWKQASARQLAPLLAEGANPTLANATSTLARLESLGISTHEPLAALSSMSDGPNFRNQLGSWISANLATPGNEVSSVVGTPADIDTGQGPQFGMRRPGFMGGGFVPGSFTQRQLTPEQNIGTVPVYITRENYQQYGQPESAINSTINVPQAAFPYRGQEGPPPTTYAPGQQPRTMPQGGAAGPRSDAGGSPPTLAQVQAPGGARFTVAANAAPQFQGLVKDLEDAGYKIDPTISGGYNPRNIAGTNTPSQHSFGLAIDINSSRNQQGAKTSSDIPQDLARQLAAKWGLRWGGDFSGNSRDPMHFEVAPHQRSDLGDTTDGQRTQIASLGLPSGVMSDVPSALIPAAAQRPQAQAPRSGMNMDIIRQNARPAGPALGVEPEVLGGTAQYLQAQAGATTFKPRTFALEQAMHALDNADTGPGSETVNHIKSFLLAQSPESLKQYLPNVDPTKIRDYDEAVKYLAQYARSQPGAANSDMQSQLSQTANASTHISPAAAQAVVRNTLGLERMNQAAYLEFNRTHPAGSGSQFPRWLTQEFLPNQDPRGFSWDDMSSSQRAAVKAQIDSNRNEAERTAAKQRLLNSARLARGNGFVAAP
jgi:hypothetical protein